MYRKRVIFTTPDLYPSRKLVENNNIYVLPEIN